MRPSGRNRNASPLTSNRPPRLYRTVSHVGIFWFVPANMGGWSALISDMAPIEEVRACSGEKRYPVHHADCWAKLARLGVHGLRRQGYPRIIAEADYRMYPRGRVDFEVGGRRFIVRADGRLCASTYIDSIVAYFDIPVGHLTVLKEADYMSIKDVGRPKPWD